MIFQVVKFLSSIFCCCCFLSEVPPVLMKSILRKKKKKHRRVQIEIKKSIADVSSFSSDILGSATRTKHPSLSNCVSTKDAIILLSLRREKTQREIKRVNRKSKCIKNNYLDSVCAMIFLLQILGIPA